MLNGKLINEVVVVLIEGAVKRDAVRLKEQVLQCVHSGQSKGLVNAVGQVGVVEDDVETESLRS